MTEHREGLEGTKARKFQDMRSGHAADGDGTGRLDHVSSLVVIEAAHMAAQRSAGAVMSGFCFIASADLRASESINESENSMRSV